ncbi:MAG: hypothetical protein M1499_03325 [Firmicutes bacterium]|jgi:hypothetical protein|nr:hypothetical protein [Bacillota bacterium]MCL5971575.1 hypothetical protein [Bacillota bacterium]
MKSVSWLLSVGLLWLTAGCGLSSIPVKNTPPVALRLVREDKTSLTWYPVTVGPEVLLNEGTSISSVMSGPHGRIYYGTGDPLADADVIGWLDPASGQSDWSSVPPVNPEFPPNSEPETLTQTQSSFWSQVDLVVSGAHTVWYRHWGYIGGWTANGSFVPGAYGIPGPTVTDGPWTASVRLSFSGTAALRVMNVATKAISAFSLPSAQTPIDLAFGSTPNHIWLLTSSELWQFNMASGSWNPAAILSSGDFFVAMGQSALGTWIIDANGNIGTIKSQGGIDWITTLNVTPLSAISGPNNGIWIAGTRHLTLWRPNFPLTQWQWPKDPYPAPASTWPTQSLNAPPDWPPLPHLAAGPNGSLDIGYGTYIGQAREQSVMVLKKVLTSGGKSS